MIYAHQHFDNPIVDAMDYHWPNKVTKFAIKAKLSTFYTMEMLKMSERGSKFSPCNLDLKYSYSKGGVYKIIFIVICKYSNMPITYAAKYLKKLN